MFLCGESHRPEFVKTDLTALFATNYFSNFYYVGHFSIFVPPTVKINDSEPSPSLVLPHQDVIPSLKAYQGDSNDIE